MNKLWVFGIACILSGGLPNHGAHAENVIVGVNVTNNDGSLSAAFQDEEIKQLAENHVTAIRVGLVSYNTDFIIKAYQHGIRSVVIVLPFLGLKSWSDVVYSKTTPEDSCGDVVSHFILQGQDVFQIPLIALDPQMTIAWRSQCRSAAFSPRTISSA